MEKMRVLFIQFLFFHLYLAFVGGLIADRLRNYKGVIFVGLIVMATKYLMIGIPTETPVANQLTMLSYHLCRLVCTAFGNGLFKGNLQALVGQCDKRKVRKMRDSGFSLFYMFINVGGFFAPFTAIGIRNWWLERHGYA